MRVAHAFLLVVLLAALVIGVWWFTFRLPVVDVITPSRGDAAEVVYATGVVEPRIWAKVTPLIRERIVELCNCEGAPVERARCWRVSTIARQRPCWPSCKRGCASPARSSRA